MISQYWVDQIPASPLSITIKDTYGADKDLSAYTSVSVEMLDEYNNEVSLTGSTIQFVNKTAGRVLFTWPTSKSVFAIPGDYVLRVKLTSSTATDFTTVHNVKVREFGGVNY
jgi:hypothetical protein